MDIKLKNKILNNSSLWNFLERFVLVLFIALLVLSITINSNMYSIKSVKQNIGFIENSLVQTNSKIHNINNYEINQVNIDWIDFNAWRLNCAIPSNLSIYKKTNNLRILSEKSQEELNKLSKSFKLTEDGNDYSRLIKFVIIDKSKLTFITNDVNNINLIKNNVKAFSQEDGQFYNYVSSIGKWYNLSYNSSSAPAGNYNDSSIIIHNPENFVEAYWFPKNYVYSREDSLLLKKLFEQSRGNLTDLANSLKFDISRAESKITMYKISIAVCGVFIFILLVLLYYLGKTRIFRGLKNNFVFKFAKFIDNKFQNKGVIFKVTVYVLCTIFTFFIDIIMLFGLNTNIITELLILFIPCTLIYFIFILPRMIKFLKYLNDIINGSNEITSGNLDYFIPEKGDECLKNLAHNINKINKGFKVSIEDKIKNERLKSQLVANVSHDLKTPLTSIINSTDILSREDISEEEREEYLKILHRKSLKLKKLIDDLFQISKINSGKVELNKKNVDVVELVNQSIAEYSDTDIYNDKNLNFIIRPFKETIEMNLDGNKMSRVFENIINNALKYSLKDTRVYVDIEALSSNTSNVVGGIKIIFKNISSNALDFDKEEIFERFTRGDESRNSHIDGNGLGLAIAKSIIELHGGKMYVDFDGDLFKSIIELY